MASDLLIDITSRDLQVESGDLVVGYADGQNLEDLMETHQGEIKADPLVGVGVSRIVKQRQGAELLLGKARLQMKADGWKDIKVKYNGRDLHVDATRSE